MAHVLAIEGKNIIEAQTKAIEEYDLNRTGIMKNRRNYKVTGVGSFANPHLEIYYVKYLRFHDMRRDKIPGYRATIFGEEATKKRRRQYHIYNRIVWGHYNNIIRELRFGYNDRVRERLAKQYNIEISS